MTITKLLRTVADYTKTLIGVKKSATELFFEDFVNVVATRGCVAYFQEATETKTNAAGVVEKYAIEATTTKLVLLPGDPCEQITKTNLVAFEPMNRQHRKLLEAERRKLTGAKKGMNLKARLNTAQQFRNLVKLSVAED